MRHPEPTVTNRPLVIDLDGTLIHTDMLHELTIRLFRDAPLITLKIPAWLSQGKAHLKENISAQVDFDPAALPYNDPLVDWIQSERTSGRSIVLCTASNRSIAERISEYLGCFDEVMASDGEQNLSGESKAKALIDRFGAQGFDYAGNSFTDMPVWRAARKAIAVNASPSLEHQVKTSFDVDRVFPAATRSARTWLRVIRAHQWLKNLLLFVPILAAHQLTSVETWVSSLLGFLAFSLCASSVYIANDLFDLESDRLHPRKRRRPFAAGIIPAWNGVALAPALLLTAIGIGSLVGGKFVAWLLVYFVLTCAYSWWLKRQILVDCLTLASLYTLRVIAGAAATHISLTFWLLAFSVFLFLSLAFVKRYSELLELVQLGRAKIHGRGYHTDDLQIVQTMGIASGYSAILVLALYLNSDAVLRLYQTPEMVWGAVLIMLYWVSRMWMEAHRGNMHDDPLIFAIKDKWSLVSGLAFGGVLILSTLKW